VNIHVDVERLANSVSWFHNQMIVKQRTVGYCLDDTETESCATELDRLPSTQLGIVGQRDPRPMVAGTQTDTFYRIRVVKE